MRNLEQLILSFKMTKDDFENNATLKITNIEANLKNYHYR